ncbi:MAG: S1 RNA-binding domain-containing protein [Planctomycetaceae bacterium]
MSMDPVNPPAEEKQPQPPVSDATTDDSATAQASQPADAESVAPAASREAVSDETAAATEVAASSPAASAPVSAAAASPASSQPQVEEEASSRPRVKLNPVADPSQLRPIASVGGDQPAAIASPVVPAASEKPATAPAANGADAVADAAQAAEATMKAIDQAPPAKRAQPVSIPRTAEIDAETEAELAAVMAGGQMDAPVVASADEEATPVTDETLEPGAKLKGTIQSVDNENVFVDLGLRMTGLVPKRQFDPKQPIEVGKQVDVVVDKIDEAEGLIVCNLPKGRAKVSGDWSSVVVGQTTECQVSATNKGGLEVSVGSLRGFMPASQVELGFASSLESYVGRTLSVRITEVNPSRRRLVVSRRALLAEERASSEESFLDEVQAGQVRTGTVKTLKDYGAFVDLGGMDGFLHIGQISWQRINKPGDVLKEGQSVEVKVLSVDREKKRVALSMRQLEQNPWARVEDRYPQGSNHTGKVSRIEQFGAFVELEPGLEGLIHISQLDHKRVARVEDVLSVGQEIEAQVVKVDPKRKRVSLSMKVLLAKPEAAPRERVEEAPPAPIERKYKGPLKGGIGGDKAGGLFGDPRNFN